MSRLILEKTTPPQAGKPFTGKYSWGTLNESIRNVRSAVSEFNPFIWQRIRLVETGQINDPLEIEKTRDLIYAIDSRLFKALSLGRVLTKGFKFFDGSYIQALIESFPKLELNRYGFPIMWKNLSRKQAQEAVRYRVFKHRPNIKAAYLEHLENPEDLEKLEDLKYMFYRLTQPDLASFGLGTLTNSKGVSHFPEHKPSHILSNVFSELDLNLYMFVGRTYKNIFEAEAAVRAILFLNYPDLEQCYASVTQCIKTGGKLDTRKFNKARRIVKQVTFDELMQLGFQYLLNKTKFPGFYGSYKRVLIRSFPILQLKPSGFDRTLHWRTIEEARENVRQAVFKNFKGLKTKYRNYQRLKTQNKFDLALLRYMISIPVISITGRRLQKLGVNLTGKGAVKYFKGSVHRALEQAFPDLVLPDLWREFEEKGYDLALSAQLIEHIRRFETIKNFALHGRSSGKTSLTEYDLAFLKMLVSDEPIGEINGAFDRVPRLVYLRFTHIRKVLAPQIQRGSHLKFTPLFNDI